MNDRVLIVSKTHMYEDACVGALTTTGQSLRLLDKDGGHQAALTPFEVGQIWNISYQTLPPHHIMRPHVEDVYVLTQTYEKTVQDIRKTLEHEKLVGDHMWHGELKTIFDGLLSFTTKGSGYISRQKGIPDRSTWFWELDTNMVLERDNKGKPYYRYAHNHNFRIKYVGFQPAVGLLKAGILLRVSLARWWAPHDKPDLEERCYLQLSGWY